MRRTAKPGVPGALPPSAARPSLPGVGHLLLPRPELHPVWLADDVATAHGHGARWPPSTALDPNPDFHLGTHKTRTLCHQVRGTLLRAC